jgi:hypothetical protein
MTYRPFNIDFAELAAQIRERQAQAQLGPRALEVIDHAVRHLVDELPDMAGRDIARVLLTASIVTGELADISPSWNGIAIVNVLASSGVQLWQSGLDNLNALLASQDEVVHAMERHKLDQQRAAGLAGDTE